MFFGSAEHAAQVTEGRHVLMVGLYTAAALLSLAAALMLPRRTMQAV